MKDQSYCSIIYLSFGETRLYPIPYYYLSSSLYNYSRISFHTLHCSCGQIHTIDTIVSTLDSENRENTSIYLPNNPTSWSFSAAFFEKGQKIEKVFEGGKIVRMKSSESSKFYFCLYIILLIYSTRR